MHSIVRINRNSTADRYGSGELGAGYKSVVIRGTAKVNDTAATTTYAAQVIRDAISAAGFGVLAVRVQWQSFFGYIADIEIEINARNEDSGEWIRQNLQPIISGITRQTIVAEYPFFVNVALSVASDPGPGQAPTNQPPSQQPGQPLPWQQNSPFPQPSQPAAAATGSWDSFFSNFASGLGVSTPIAVLGGGVLLLLFLKKL